MTLEEEVKSLASQAGHHSVRERRRRTVTTHRNHYYIKFAVTGPWRASLCDHGLRQREEPDAAHCYGMGRRIVKLEDRWRRPFLVRIPLVNVPKGFVTDERLARWFDGSVTLSGLKRAVVAESARERRPRLGDNGLSPDELTFVEDVIEGDSATVPATVGMGHRRMTPRF